MTYSVTSLVFKILKEYPTNRPCFLTWVINLGKHNNGLQIKFRELCFLVPEVNWWPWRPGLGLGIFISPSDLPAWHFSPKRRAVHSADACFHSRKNKHQYRACHVSWGISNMSIIALTFFLNMSETWTEKVQRWGSIPLSDCSVLWPFLLRL